jgi:hypothetical protein
MSQSSAAGHSVAGSSTRDLSTVALVLGLISVPGSIMTWGALPGGGFVWGAPLALVAVVLGVTSLSHSRGKAIAAIVLGGAMLAMMLVWTLTGLA